MGLVSRAPDEHAFTVAEAHVGLWIAGTLVVQLEAPVMGEHRHVKFTDGTFSLLLFTWKP